MDSEPFLSANKIEDLSLLTPSGGENDDEAQNKPDLGPQKLGEGSEYQGVEAQCNGIESHRAGDIALTWVETQEGVPFALKRSLVAKWDPPLHPQMKRHATRVFFFSPRPLHDE